MSPVLTIDGRALGPDRRPFIVAEISGNHQGSLAQARRLFEAAAEAGVDAVKLQTYTADAMTLDVDAPGFRIEDPNNLWHGERLHRLYQKAATPWEWHGELFEYGRSLGLVVFSAPFDASAVERLETLGCPIYKIASFELVDHPLIRAAAATGKPLVMSTGMASLAEIEAAVNVARKAGAGPLILLKCTSSYPALPADSHLRTLPHLQQAFGCPVGLSDHTLGIGAALASVALGAVMIEKHFVLDRDSDAVDAAFSLEPAEFAQLVAESERAWQALGQVHYGGAQGDRSEKQYRRSLYIAAPVRRGEVLTPENLRVVRPGGGLAPRYYDLVLGKRVRHDLTPGTPLAWDHLLEGDDG